MAPSSMSAAVPMRPRSPELAAYVGMLIFLSAWAMTFAALFFSYAVVRSQTMSWPPAGSERLPMALPALNTALLLLSSFTFHRAFTRVRSGQSLLGSLAATIGLGAAFLALQTVVWFQVYHSGLHPSSAGNYGSVFYALTVFHGLHVAFALLWALYLVPGAFAGKYTARKHTAVRMAAMFWHFVDAIWVVMFFSVYVF